MHEAVADHFVFALEALSGGVARAVLHGAVVGAVLAVDVAMGAVDRVRRYVRGGWGLYIPQEVLRLKRHGVAVGIIASEAAGRDDGHAG